MTELVIKENNRNPQLEAGQLRANESGTLVLVTKNITGKFNVVYLKSKKMTEFTSWSSPGSYADVTQSFPLVIDNVKITVELNADAPERL